MSFKNGIVKVFPHGSRGTIHTKRDTKDPQTVPTNSHTQIKVHFYIYEGSFLVGWFQYCHLKPIRYIYYTCP